MSNPHDVGNQERRTGRRAGVGRTMRTQVAIIGAGPAGMFLAHLLHAAGIGCIVLERRDRAYVEGRVRAGVLEPITVETMQKLELSQGLDRDGLPHGGVNISIGGELLRIDLA